MTGMNGGRSRRPRLLLLLTAIAVVVAAAVATGVEGSPSSAVSPVQAQRVVRAYDRAETLATLRLSAPAQDAVEVPPESIIDDATFAALHDQGQRRSAPAPQTDVRITVYVPVQHRGAETFAAYVSSRVHGQPGAILMVFRRTRAGGRWRQSMSPAYPGAGSPPPVAVGAGGYVQSLGPSTQARRLRLTAGTVAADYAGLLELAGRGDRLASGNPFAAGAYTSRLAASDRQVVAQLTGAGGTVTGTALPAPYSGLTLRLRGGGGLVLFTVSVRQSFAARAGLSLRQAANRTPWSPLLAPGSYRQVSTTTLMTVAAVVPPAGSASPVRVVAETASVIAVRALQAGSATTA